jgi:hypothetical protein
MLALVKKHHRRNFGARKSNMTGHRYGVTGAIHFPWFVDAQITFVTDVNAWSNVDPRRVRRPEIPYFSVEQL